MRAASLRACPYIVIKLSDPKSLSSWYIKSTDYSTLITDSLVSLMQHDPSDFGSMTLIQMTPKEHSQKFNRQLFVAVVVLQLSSQQDVLE